MLPKIVTPSWSRTVCRRHRWIVPLLLAFLLFGIGWLPYRTAQKAQDTEHIFHGYLHFPEDMDSYAAFIRQSYDGATLFYNPYSPEHKGEVYVNTLWWLAGKLQPGDSLDLPLTVQGLRLLAVLALIGGFWLLAGRLGVKAATRPLALAWFAFGGGLGWLATVYPTHTPPLDSYTELFPFFQATLVPHAGIAHGVLLLVLAGAFLATQTQRPVDILAPALWMILLGSFRPYDLIVAAGVVAFWSAVYALWTRRLGVLRAGSLILLPAVLWAIYWRWLSQSGPGFEAWGQANVYPPPAPLWMAFGVGTPILGLILAPWAHLKRPQPGTSPALVFTALWAGVALLLMFSGLLPFAWRTCAAFVTPFLLLGVLSLDALVASERKRMFLLVFFLLSSLGSSYLVLDGKSREAAEQNRYYFQPSDVLRAMRWVGARYPGAVVMTHGHIGLKLPAYGPVLSIAGHKDMTASFEQKRLDYHRFVNAPSPRDAEVVLDRLGADIFLFGPLDRRFGSLNPDNLPAWRQVFENRQVSIYRRRSLPEPEADDE